MMCLPRVIELQDKHICFRVHPAVEEYFAGSPKPVDEIDFHNPWRMKVTLKKGDELTIGGYRIWEENDCIHANRSQVFDVGDNFRFVSSTPKLGGKYDLDIFVEPNLIEIFINDGQYTLSHVVYGLQECVGGKIGEVYLPQ